MEVKLQGLCLGTQTKTSTRKGTQYTETVFVDTENGKSTVVYGDLGLPRDMTPREYVLTGVAIDRCNAEAVQGRKVKE